MNGSYIFRVCILYFILQVILARFKSFYTVLRFKLRFKPEV
jgi:hypothetical protein